MIILTIRSDKPESELGLFQDSERLTYEKWEAHRQLAETIHKKLEVLLISQKKDWRDIEGIVCYQGPGSFTGLRIGLSVANAIAGSLEVPIVAKTGEEWLADGIKALHKGENNHAAMPEYGSPVHTTQPKR